MTDRQQAIQELDRYAKMAIRHSHDQYGKHGTLHDVARRGFSASDVWFKPWVPADFDIGNPYTHPVYASFSEEQKLAWNHLQWGLEYTVVGQGERQIITLNKYAVQQYRHILPSVVDLEDRESFEEIDHLAAFQVGLDALHERYLPHLPSALWSIPASGFRSNDLNKLMRSVLGRIANRLLGSNFPTLFFLTRGMKTHNFKPFENGIAQFKEGPQGVSRVSHLHRLDESRHMATALHIARLSNTILDTLNWESQTLFKAAIHAAWPKARQAEYRITYWKTALYQANIFAHISQEDKNSLFQHISHNITNNLQNLHERQTRLTRQANKKIVELAGLSPELKRCFVETLRKDPIHANLVDTVLVQ